MKNKTFFILFIILIITLLLRLWNIDKAEGLWNDEYVGWYIASRSSFSEFLELVSKNCHTPLYYFFLKFWLLIFPDTDISLRISSVLPSFLTVIVMFFIGREYKDKNSGILCAFFTALSSFYIYFAQEVRLYSLLSFIASLIILFCIKLLKEGNKAYFFIFIILNALLCSVHTLGLIFSFFIILYSLVYLYKNFAEWKKIIKDVNKIIQYIFPFMLVLFLILPFILFIIFGHTLSQFWSEFSLSKIIFSFIDYFSPIQCNITNSPNNFKTYLYKNDGLNYIFLFFGIIPSIMAIIAIVKGVLQREKILNILMLSSLSFLLVIIILSILGKMIIITKYTSEIYPVLILAFIYGVTSFRNKTFIKIFLCIYFIISSIYLYISPVSAPKLNRPEGNKYPIALIEQSRLKYGDYIIFTYYDIDRFKRYFNDTEKYNIYSVNKFNFHNIIFKNDNYYEVIKEGKDLYRTKFKEFPNKNIIDYTNENIISRMKTGERVGIIFLNGVSFFSNEKIKQIEENETKYNKTSFIFMTFSMLRNSLMYAFKDKYRIDSITQAGDWILIVYEKK